MARFLSPLAALGGKSSLGSQVAAFVIPALVLVLRMPSAFLHPQLYADDGIFFFHDAWEGGFLQGIFEPSAGYLQLLPRLVASSSLLLPFTLTPLVYSLASLLVMLLPIFYLLSERIQRDIPSRRARVVCAIAYAAMPASQGTYGNLAHTQWYLAIAACLICASTPPATKRQALCDAIVLGLCSTSFPLAVLFIPIVGYQLVRRWRLKHKLIIFAAPAALVLGVAVQAIFLLSSQRVTHATPLPWSLASAIREFSMFGFFNAVLGANVHLQVSNWFSDSAYLAGLVPLLFLAARAIKLRLRLPLILLYATVAIFSVMHIFPLPQQTLSNMPNQNLRYYLLTVLFVLLSVILLILRDGRLRFLGLALLAPAIGVGIPMDYSHDLPMDTHFADQAAVFQGLPPGTSFSFPLAPMGLVTITAREQDTSSPVLTGLSRLPGSPLFSLQEISLNRDYGVPAVRVRGAAFDSNSGRLAGGVNIIVDGRVFPAVTGYRFDDVTSTIPSQGTGFLRDIPVAELGAGTHQLSLVILSHDRTASFPPVARAIFEIP